MINHFIAYHPCGKELRRYYRRFPLSLFLLLAAVGLGACAPRGVKVEPPVVMPQGFSTEGQAVMPEKWWTALADAQLNALIDKALEDNFSLRTTWDRLDRARATAARSGAPLLPAIDGTADVTRSVRKIDPAPRTYLTQYGLGLIASYEVDLWGRVRSAFDAARLDVYASKEDLHAAAITLTTQVALTWYELIEQRGQLKLLDEQIATNKKYLEIIVLRFRRGRVSATDVLQQRQLIESLRGERLLVESSAKVLEHTLSVLLGRTPGAFEVEIPNELPPLPALPKTGLPAEWIRKRPDVRAAELRVQAADQRVAAAVADQFPRLSIVARADTTDERIRDLFDNWLASLAGNIIAPLFDGGERRAEVRRTRAVVSEQLNAYGDIVLTSLKEVEDALSQEIQQARYVKSLQDQLKLAKQSTDQTLENYTKGTMDFIRYLTAVLSYQSLQRNHLRAERELIQFRIDLYRALAGSWALPRPEPRKVSGPRKVVEDPFNREQDEPGRSPGV